MMTSGMYSSNSSVWETPQELFDKYDAIYHFDVDVCALPENAKCKNYFTPEIDGLKMEWGGDAGATLHMAGKSANGLKKRMNQTPRL